jgi:hypothetical protein
MKPFSTIAKRLFVAGSLLLVTACGTNGVTDPTAAPKKSGYLTVSAQVNTNASGYNVPASVTLPAAAAAAPTTITPSGVKRPGMMTNAASGYNVPAN